MTPRPVLVGEANPYGADPYFALYPLPERSAGGRLCTVIMGLSVRDYLRRFERVNLCPAKWSAPIARERAKALASEYPGATLVLFGAKVCGAFGLPFDPFTAHGGSTRVVLLPHPSGRCRLWYAPGAIERGRQVLQAAGVLEACPGG